MTKLGKYISDLLGKKEGRIYFDPTIEDYRYEENDELVYGEEILQSEKKKEVVGQYPASGFGVLGQLQKVQR